MIMYPSTYKGQSIPGFVGSGNWKLKGNKVSVNYHLSDYSNIIYSQRA